MSGARGIKALASESLIYGLSGVLSRFIGVFLTPFYTRVYTPADYGVFGMLNNSYVLITIVLVFALDNSTARWFYDSEDREHRKTTINTWIWFYFPLACITGLVVFMASPYLAQRYFPEYPDATAFIRLMCLSLPMMSWFSIASTVLRFERKVIATITLTLVQALLLIALNILFVLVLRLGLLGAYYAQMIASFVAMALSIYFIKGWIAKPGALSFKRLREMIAFSVPFIPASLAFWVVNLSGAFFIGSVLSKTEVGLYQIATSIAAVVGLATNAFQQAWSPFAFSILNEKNAKEVYARVLEIYTILVGVFCMVVSLFSQEALAILATEKYYGAAFTASILCFSYFFIGLTYISDLGAAIAKKTAPLGFINTVAALLIVGLNLLLIPLAGIEGAALSILLSQAIVPVYMFYRSQKLYYIPYNFKKSAGVFLGILFVALFVRFISTEISPLFILFKGILVLLVLFILYFINKAEVNQFVKLYIRRKNA